MTYSIAGLTSKNLRQAIRIKEKIETLESKLAQILETDQKLPGVTPSKPKRRMSAAAKAKIAAVARARWKKAKAAGKSTL